MLGSNLAIIPARGGSKRIPKKNVKDFVGKPVIAYSIELALASGLFQEVMVSTDDEQIAEVAKKLGAKVPFLRSIKNSSDYATTMDVIKEVLEHYELIGRRFDYVCCIYPTAPLIQIRHLRDGYEQLEKLNFDSVFPVVAFSHPIWRGLKIEDGKTKTLWPQHWHTRSQDLIQVFHDAGQWYWFTPLRIKDSIFTDNTGSIVLSEEEVQDIDTLSDWKLAEMKYRLLHG